MKRTHSRLLALLLVTLLPLRSASAADDRCTPTNRPVLDLLSMDVESLLQIKVVTASKFAQDVADAPGVVSVVSQDELQRFGGTTLAEVLARVPGFQSTTAYFTDRSIVAARGDQTKINGGHILFLINGRPTREVLEGGIVSDLLESFPVNALERIEIIKGPGSVLYGSNAFSAVVNLITKKADRNGFSLAGLPGAAGTLASSGTGTFSCGSFSLVGAAQVHQRADWNTIYRYTNPLPGDPIAATESAMQNVTIRDRSRGGFIGLTYKNLRVMSSFTTWQTSSFVRGTVGENEWKRGFADVGYAIRAASNWTMNVDLTYTRNTFAAPLYPNIKRDSHEAVAEWTNVLTPTRADRVTFGALYNHTAGSEVYYGLGSPVPISNGDRSGGAGYAQIDHELSGTVTLIGGVQVNTMTNIAVDAVPRAGVLWSPARHVSVKALYGQAFRAPSINETTLDHPGLAGTPGLLPEKVGTFDLELAYTGDRVQSSVNAFRSRQTDSIVVDTAPARWRYVNLGETTFRGIEVDGKYYVTQDLFATGSMTYQTSDNTLGPQFLSPVPSTSVKAGVSYQRAGRLTASLFDVFSGAVQGYDLTANPAPVSYHMLNAELRFEFAPYFRNSGAKGLAFVLHAENIGNERVWLPDWGDNTSSTIPTYRGRTIYAGVEISLNRPGRRSKKSVVSAARP